MGRGRGRCCSDVSRGDCARQGCEGAVMRLLALLLALIAFTGEACAHQTSLSYVSVEDKDGSVAASVKMSFLDLEVAAGVDQDFDGRITWGEAKAAVSGIAAYVQSHTVMSAGGPCALRQVSAAPE